jgi:CheY-like chemotaxis protein
MLEDLGHRVEQACSAAEALDLLARGQSFDIVVTDHAMPGMTGLQLAEALGQSQPGLPIILATGYAELPVAADTASLPRLSKPFTQDDLAAMIASVVRSSSLRPPLGERRAS